MSRVRRAVGTAGLCFFLAGCNTGGGLPQQLEPTKPQMDKEKETNTPAPKSENAKAFGSSQ